MINLITENIDIWTSAQTQKNNGAGRGNGSANHSLYGIKKLRELILELAVRGKLVPQDPNDEPASVLLEKIAREKARLIKEGRFKKQEPLSEVTYDENPYELPDGWSWIRLGDIANLVYGKNLPTTKLIDTGFDVFGANGVIGKHTSYIYEAPQVLISCRGAYSGKANMSPKKCFITNNSIVCELTKNSLNNIFLYLSLSAIDKNKIVTGSAQPQVTVANANPVILAVPPLAEQHRIVAKVDELMAICDQLEQQQAENNTAHQTLVETLLAILTSAANQDEFIETWQRIASHFDILFTTEQSIDQLKRTILQLAVMGKLVPQDPSDESASVLLEKIAKEKARLIKEGKIKKEKPLPETGEEEKPFDLPNGWVWKRFGSIVNFKSELVSPSDFLNLDQIAPDSIEKGTGKLLYRRTVLESGIIGPNNKFYTGQILYSKIRPSLSKAVIAPFDGLCSADMYPLESMINAEFLLQEMLSELFLKQVRVVENRIKMPKLNVESLSNIVVAIPPLAEQHRIVAKVDELMTICDALKAKINEAQTTQIHLANAIVEQAVG